MHGADGASAGRGGGPEATPVGAETDAEQTRRWWRGWLGAAPDPAGTWEFGAAREPQHPGMCGPIQQLVLSSYGSDLVCEFHRPASVSPTGVTVVSPFYDTAPLFGEHSERTRRSDRDPALGAYGLRLAEAGHAVLAVPWWFEQVSAADPATAGADTLEERYGAAAERHRREQPMTALGRCIGDLMLAVTALQESGLAAGDRLAVFGHSLGGKLTMHLAALDTRLDAGAAHEPGLGFAHSNWSAPWYQDGELPAGRDQDELLGLVAPRPFLFAGGGESDGAHNLELYRAARSRWPEEAGLDLLLHDDGHALPRHVMAWIREWLTNAIE